MNVMSAWEIFFVDCYTSSLHINYASKNANREWLCWSVALCICEEKHSTNDPKQITILYLESFSFLLLVLMKDMHQCPTSGTMSSVQQVNVMLVRDHALWYCSKEQLT